MRIMDKLNIYEKLSKVQTELKAPKNQYNSFGEYKYRSCEDILESLKPLLLKNKLTLILSDELIQVGERYYVRAKVTIFDSENNTSLFNTALAREPEKRKGMDDSQITGTASSYSRKYALNGMFAIDDTKDSDFFDNRENQNNNKEKQNKISDDNLKKLCATANSKLYDYKVANQILDYVMENAVKAKILQSKSKKEIPNDSKIINFLIKNVKEVVNKKEEELKKKK
jgi:hypothetical protein